MFGGFYFGQPYFGQSTGEVAIAYNYTGEDIEPKNATTFVEAVKSRVSMADVSSPATAHAAVSKSLSAYADANKPTTSYNESQKPITGY